MEIINLRKVKLASVNQKYILSRGRMILSPVYRQFKNFLISILFPKVQNYSKKQSYALFIDVRSNLDIDNMIKPIMDAVFDAIDDNDRKVNYLVVRKETCKRNEENCLRVSIQEWEPEKLF